MEGRLKGLRVWEEEIVKRVCFIKDITNTFLFLVQFYRGHFPRGLGRCLSMQMSILEIKFKCGTPNWSIAAVALRIPAKKNWKDPRSTDFPANKLHKSYNQPWWIFQWSSALYQMGINFDLPGQSMIKIHPDTGPKSSCQSGLLWACTPKAKINPPLGPYCNSSMTSSTETKSRISLLGGWTKFSAAGSKFIRWALLPILSQCSNRYWQNVDYRRYRREDLWVIRI